MQYGAGAGSGDVVGSRGGEIDPTVPVRGKVVRTMEGLAAPIRGERTDLRTVRIELDDRVGIVAGDQQVILAEPDQATGSTAGLFPVLLGRVAIPELDVVGRVLDKQERAVVPQRAFRIHRGAVQDGHLRVRSAGRPEDESCGHPGQQAADAVQRGCASAVVFQDVYIPNSPEQTLASHARSTPILRRTPEFTARGSMDGDRPGVLVRILVE